LWLSVGFPHGGVEFSLEFVHFLVKFRVVIVHFFMEAVIDAVEHALPEIGP
jgi:hypothetical protein